MNIFKIVFFSLMLTAVSASAQYGNSYGGMRNNGIPQSEPKKPSPEAIEKERAERIDKIMEKLKTELNLDELQFIAIKNEIAANNKSIEIVIKSENSDEDKGKEVKAIQEKTDKTINSYLNTEQKEKYQKLKEERNSKKDDRNDKKKKKAEDSKPE
ncbi:hypothetical protein [Flavobacterium sp.]|uniref:hypothetical protein n=1 Tax=Flavobacterium sp. TaxID=239 RepID=UPI002FDA91D5